MSSSRASSTKDSSVSGKAVKRGSQQTKGVDNDNGLDRKTKRRGNDQNRESQKRKTSEKKIRFYEVFVAKFSTGRRGSDAHRSLFVAKEKERDLCWRGDVYEVTGPNEYIRVGASVFQFKFADSVCPEHSTRFLSLTRVGRISAAKLDCLYNICAATEGPSGPRRYIGRPDCNDWVHNVILKLKRQDVIEFSANFSAPTEEAPLEYDASGNYPLNMFLI